MKTLTQKDLQLRWRYDEHSFPSIKTVRRDIKRFGLRPFRFRGLQPFFRIQDVARMERRRDQVRRAALGYDDERDGGSGIISVRKAKAIARRGRK